MAKERNGAADKDPKQPRVRGAMGRTMMRIPLVRRWYIKRMLKWIDKSKAKGRRLPENLNDTARYLARVPKQQRAQALEDAILAQQEMPNMGRDVRRAASRQRQSGKGGGRQRPGLPPGALKQAGQQGRKRP